MVQYGEPWYSTQTTVYALEQAVISILFHVFRHRRLDDVIDQRDYFYESQADAKFEKGTFESSFRISDQYSKDDDVHHQSPASECERQAILEYRPARMTHFRYYDWTVTSPGASQLE